ncbi:unnamed protein product [Clavelina lepadiformis]|uniref:Uncharacterized protein n=1 Tax=Clavelina lepadiformis TaxID=159417 RepID=A0ABP0H3C8_CLALP
MNPLLRNRHANSPSLQFFWNKVSNPMHNCDLTRLLTRWYEENFHGLFWKICDMRKQKDSNPGRIIVIPPLNPIARTGKYKTNYHSCPVGSLLKVNSTAYTCIVRMQLD